MEQYHRSPAVSVATRRADVRAKGKEWAAEGVNAQNAWHRLVLTLDGGGIRGYAELLILQALMKRIVAFELELNNQVIDINEILPCHYFDYMWGTSTGGLVALMLARLRMNVPQALEVYRKVGYTIFGETRALNLRGWNPVATKYKHHRVKEAVVQITRDHCKMHENCDAEETLLWPEVYVKSSDLAKGDTNYIKPDTPTLERGNDGIVSGADEIPAQTTNSADPTRATSDSTQTASQIPFRLDDEATEVEIDLGWDMCQAVCVTARATGKSSQAQPLRSYVYRHPDSLYSHDPYAGIQDLDLKIWEAARATSAAPLYFKIFEKRDPENGQLRRYKDGGTLLNNAAERALEETRDRYGLDENGCRVDPSLLLSIGTGMRDNTPFAQLQDFSYGRRKEKTLWQSIRIRAAERLAVAKHIVMRYTEGEHYHRAIREAIGNEHTWYRRLNVDVGLGKMSLGDWRPGLWHNPLTGEDEHHTGGATLTDMEQAVDRYLTRTELHTANNVEWDLLPSEHLDHIAERLVRHRMERRKLADRSPEDRRRWHIHQGRYATGKQANPWTDDSSDKPHIPVPETSSKLDSGTSIGKS